MSADSGDVSTKQVERRELWRHRVAQQEEGSRSIREFCRAGLSSIRCGTGVADMSVSLPFRPQVGISILHHQTPTGVDLISVGFSGS